MYSQPPTFDTVMTNADDTAVILYTSGTTGSPKGAELSHSNMIFNARLSDTMYTRFDGDVHLVALPLFHSFGQSVQMNAGFYNRCTLSLLARFDPDTALAVMERDNVTIFAGVPTMYWAMLNHPNPEKFDLQKIARNLRLAVSGGSAMPVEVMRAFGEKFTVDTGHLVAFPENIGFVVRAVGGIKSTLFSGEGLVVDLTGPGRILMQTRSTDAFLSWLVPQVQRRMPQQQSSH